MQNEVLRFILVGIINTIFYYALYSTFIFFGIDYKISVLFANIIGIFFNFKTFGKYVFNNEERYKIFIFIAVYIVLYFININFVKLFNQISNNYYISGFLALIPTVISSFILNKYLVFRK